MNILVPSFMIGSSSFLQKKGMHISLDEFEF